ncbi:hypothetical protein [Limnohabitans sp.]|jgi:hypothetical protein|uniref:hypothetical protein n=1 Tax=Limnohabitans sp. TaxID=1907725 RepID=UPI00260D1B2F|nr:hypothetical protein [Limnohabitans sp.]
MIEKINDGVYALHDPTGLHVGHFKWIQGQWKFKAVGYGPSGQLIPGGGPLTDRHNTSLAQLDEALIRATFFEKE